MNRMRDNRGETEQKKNNKLMQRHINQRQALAPALVKHLMMVTGKNSSKQKHKKQHADLIS